MITYNSTIRVEDRNLTRCHRREKHCPSYRFCRLFLDMNLLGHTNVPAPLESIDSHHLFSGQRHSMLNSYNDTYTVEELCESVISHSSQETVLVQQLREAGPIIITVNSTSMMLAYNLSIYLMMIVRIFVRNLIKSEVWTIWHCLGLRHEEWYALYVFLYYDDGTQ